MHQYHAAHHAHDSLETFPEAVKPSVAPAGAAPMTVVAIVLRACVRACCLGGVMDVVARASWPQRWNRSWIIAIITFFQHNTIYLALALLLPPIFFFETRPRPRRSPLRTRSTATGRRVQLVQPVLPPATRQRRGGALWVERCVPTWVQLSALRRLPVPLAGPLPDSDSTKRWATHCPVRKNPVAPSASNPHTRGAGCTRAPAMPRAHAGPGGGGAG